MFYLYSDRTWFNNVTDKYAIQLLKLIIIQFFFFIVMKQFLDIASILMRCRSGHNQIAFFMDFLKSKSSVYCLLNKTFFFPNVIFMCLLFWCDWPVLNPNVKVVSVYEQMFWIGHEWETLKRSQKHCLLGKFAPPERRAQMARGVGMSWGCFSGFATLRLALPHTPTHIIYQKYECLSPYDGMLWGKNHVNSHFKRSQL